MIERNKQIKCSKNVFPVLRKGRAIFLSSLWHRNLLCRVVSLSSGCICWSLVLSQIWHDCEPWFVRSIYVGLNLNLSLYYVLVCQRHSHAHRFHQSDKCQTYYPSDFPRNIRETSTPQSLLNLRAEWFIASRDHIIITGSDVVVVLLTSFSTISHIHSILPITATTRV